MKKNLLFWAFMAVLVSFMSSCNEQQPETKEVIVEAGDIVIPMERDGDNQLIHCEVNGLPMDMEFDTGASCVAMSMVELNYLLKNGYVDSDDVSETQGRSIIADGSEVANYSFVIRELTVGDITLNNVPAIAINNNRGAILFGQSAIRMLHPFSIAGENLIVHRGSELNVNTADEDEEEDQQPLGYLWITSIMDEDYEQAMTYAMQFERLHPGEWESSAFIGKTYFEQGDYQEAITWLKKAVDDNPMYDDFTSNECVLIINFEDIVNKLAISYRRLKDFDSCIDVCKNVLQSHPEYYSMSDIMACAYGLRNQEGDCQMARNISFELLNLNVTTEITAKCYFRLAWLYEREGKIQAAMNLYEKCISLDSSNSEAYNNLSVLYNDSDPFYSLELKKCAAFLGNKQAIKFLERMGIEVPEIG